MAPTYTAAELENAVLKADETAIHMAEVIKNWPPIEAGQAAFRELCDLHFSASLQQPPRSKITEGREASAHFFNRQRLQCWSKNPDEIFDKVWANTKLRRALLRKALDITNLREVRVSDIYSFWARWHGCTQFPPATAKQVLTMCRATSVVDT